MTGEWWAGTPVLCSYWRGPALLEQEAKSLLGNHWSSKDFAGLSFWSIGLMESERENLTR